MERGGGQWAGGRNALTRGPAGGGRRQRGACAGGGAAARRAGRAGQADRTDPLPRHTAVAAYLHERDGDLPMAARLYAEAARRAPNLAERDHLTRQAARLNTRARH